jgi:hypothetical protein
VPEQTPFAPPYSNEPVFISKKTIRVTASVGALVAWPDEASAIQRDTRIAQAMGGLGEPPCRLRHRRGECLSDSVCQVCTVALRRTHRWTDSAAFRPFAGKTSCVLFRLVLPGVWSLGGLPDCFGDHRADRFQQQFP